MSVTINNVRVDFHLSPPKVTFLQGANMDVPTIRDNLRLIEETDEGRMQFRHEIVEASGNENFSADGSVKNAMTITILPPYVVEFQAGATPFQTSNGNLLGTFLDSPGAVVQINNAVGALSLNNSAIEFSSYLNGVWVDAINGTAGTTYPKGTRQYPVNNIPDAVSIATEKGFERLFVLGNYVFDTGDNVAGFTIEGQNPKKSIFVLNPGADTFECEFKQATITGTLDGDCMLEECYVLAVNYVEGSFYRCMLGPGTILLSGTENSHFLDCWSGVPGTGAPVIDCGGSGRGLAFRAYSGGVQLINKTGPEAVTIETVAGNVILDSTVTDGYITVRGIGGLTDNSTGTTVVESSKLMNKDTVASAVWDDQTSDHMGTGTFGAFVQKLLTVAKFIGLK